MCVDEAAVVAADLDEPELGDVARDRGLHRVEPLVPQRLDDVALGRELPLPDEPKDHPLPFELVHRSTSSSRASPSSTSSPEIVSGGVSRRTVSPAVPTSKPAARQAAATGPAERSSSAPSIKPRPRTSTTPGSPARPAASRSPRSRTEVSRASSIVSTTAPAAAHETGLPPNVLP